MLVFKNNLRRGYNEYFDISKKPYEMRMGVLKHVAGEFEMIIPSGTEKVLLVLNGDIEFEVNDKDHIEAMRKNVFRDYPKALHVDKDTLVKVEFKSDGEVLLQEVDNDQKFPYVFYDENNVTVKLVGQDEGALHNAQRFVIDIINNTNSPYSNLVFGETITLPGNWTGFPPHFHPQPEMAFYRFSKPEGFGVSFVDEVIFQVKNNSAVGIIPGKLHPAAAAPGYVMWNMWAIRHLPDQRFESATFAPEHEWTLKSNDDKFYQLYLRKENAK